MQQQVQPSTQQQQQHQQQQQQPAGSQQRQEQQPAGQQGSYPGVLHNRRAGDKVHFCISCQLPIAVYGRLLPCLHAFCLTCASDMPKCFICLADINRMERVSQPLFISSATLQSFANEESLARHTQNLYAHLKNDPVFGSKMQLQPGRPRAAVAAGAGWQGGAVAAVAGGGGQ